MFNQEKDFDEAVDEARSENREALDELGNKQPVEETTVETTVTEKPAEPDSLGNVTEAVTQQPVETTVTEKTTTEQVEGDRPDDVE